MPESDSSGTRAGIAVTMLGPRMHYAVPLIFQRAGLLTHFFTDSYAGNKPFVRALITRLPQRFVPGALRRWMGRVCADIPPERITSFEMLGLRYGWRRFRAGGSSNISQVFAETNRDFDEAVLRRGLGSALAVWGFNSASLELFSSAKKQGRLCILEQTILPRVEEEGLMAAQWKRWRSIFADIDLSTGQPNLESPLAQREVAEWALADHIVVGSRFVAQGLEKCGVAADKISVIPYGVDAANYGWIERNAPKRRLKVLFAGEVGLRKGAPDLLEALRILGPDRVEARFAGKLSLPREWLSQFAEVATFLGIVPRVQMAELYAWADVFVLPSIVEGSATVTYEAILSGLPIVVTPNAGSIIEHDRQGQIIPCGDSMAISNALQRYLDAPELWERHAQGARDLRDAADLSRYERDLAALARRLLETMRAAVVQ